MTRPGRPGRFRPQQPAPSALPPRTKDERPRGSPRERGYSSRWDRLAIAFRKQHPYCRWCEQEGRDELTDLVDHILPTQDFPERVMEWKNLQALCRRHHGQKERLEVYARETGQLQRLVEWSVDPVSRAKVLRL